MPANFPLGYAEELAANKIRVRRDERTFLAGARGEIGKGNRNDGPSACELRKQDSNAAIEILKASKPGAGKRLRWNGKTLTSEILRAEIDSTILRAGGVPTGTIVAGGDQACDPHERGYGPLYADSLIILDVFPRDAKTGYFGDMTRTVLRGRASEAQRKLWETVKAGQALALTANQGRRRWDDDSQGNPGIFRQTWFSDGSAQRPTGRILSRHRARSWIGDPRASAFAKSYFKRSTGADR